MTDGVLSVEVAILPLPRSGEWLDLLERGELRCCALEGCMAQVTFRDEDRWVCWLHGQLALRDKWNAWDEEFTLRGTIRSERQHPTVQRLIDECCDLGACGHDLLEDV